MTDGSTLEGFELSRRDRELAGKLGRLTRAGYTQAEKYLVRTFIALTAETGVDYLPFTAKSLDSLLTNVRKELPDQRMDHVPIVGEQEVQRTIDKMVDYGDLERKPEGHYVLFANIPSLIMFGVLGFNHDYAEAVRKVLPAWCKEQGIQIRPVEQTK